MESNQQDTSQKTLLAAAISDGAALVRACKLTPQEESFAAKASQRMAPMLVAEWADNSPSSQLRPIALAAAAAMTLIACEAVANEAVQAMGGERPLKPGELATASRAG